MRATLITIIALLAAGCGGGDDGAADEAVDVVDDVDDIAESADGAVDDAADEADEAVDEADDVVDDVVDEASEAIDDAEEAADGDGSGTNTATVTVGDQTFDFEWQVDAIHRCDTDFFGGFWALDAAVDGGPSLNAEIWPDDAADPTQISKVMVENGDDRYIADPESTVGTTADTWPAQVDSFEIDGNTVTGTATFVGNFAFDEEPEPIPGTFEITCSG